METFKNKQILFIADLHLSDSEPDLGALLSAFLHRHAADAAALYILGDLFDAWTGDDDDSRTAAETAAALHAFSRHAPVYFIAGNRDFLLGRRYAEKAGITLLPETHILHAFGRQILLTHGDEMCTGDTGYLRYRRIMRNKTVQKILLSLPFGLRKKIAAKLRAASRRKKQSAAAYAVSDVTESGVQAALNRFPQVRDIIHGHTHRPARHEHIFRGKTVVRHVLQDWRDGKGGYLSLDAAGNITAHALPE